MAIFDYLFIYFIITISFGEQVIHRPMLYCSNLRNYLEKVRLLYFYVVAYLISGEIRLIYF